MTLNFIDWPSFKDVILEGGTSLAEYAAQYAAVQTNWVYTLAAIIAIAILLIKKNKKWYWYLFILLYMIMSVTSVGTICFFIPSLYTIAILYSGYSDKYSLSEG